MTDDQRDNSNIMLSTSVLFFVALLITGIIYVRGPSKPEPSSCRSDWKLCADNGDFINHWDGHTHAALSCEHAANERVKYGELTRYGDPEWPAIPFSLVPRGDDIPKTGKATFVENDARFPNGFGAKERMRVTCDYDLNTGTTEDVRITSR